ncbi:site-specific integrase [Bordetella avium]|uniref:Phage integrase n=1 Tax=Bordetella avium (strain 197N) TaxID=360910 RepID=Q2L302_BORA1|nr:site-specific integrase [Bordetella avium]CAJ48887.1 Putative phage integrase [Bordetella avium 197N]
MGRSGAGTTPTAPRGVTIRELKDGPRVQIAFSYQGQQCRELLPPGKITKTFLEYAAGLRAEIRRKIADGTFSYKAYFPHSPLAARLQPGQDGIPGGPLLLGVLLDQQLALYQKQAENGSISHSTLLGYTKAINHFLKPRWGETPVAELAPADLRAWIAGMGVTGKTVRNRLTPLRSVLDDAVNDELLESSPLDRIALGKLIKQTSRKSDYEVDPFDMDEVQALYRAAREDERPFIQFWLETGLRPGEVMAVSWGGVDWIHNTIRIEENIVTGIVDGKVAQVLKKPKTKSGIRDIELSPLAVAALQAQKAYSFLAGGRIWHDPRRSQPWATESQIRKSLWQPLCKRAGVRYRNPYQMRHTFASTHLTAGRNPYWVANQMGHVDVEMVFKIYGKFIPLNYQKAGAFTPISHRNEATG